MTLHRIQNRAAERRIARPVNTQETAVSVPKEIADMLTE